MVKPVENQLLAFSKKAFFKRSVFAVAAMSVAVGVQAGKISTNPGCGTEGFDGWNLDNVDILMPDGQVFESSCGTYNLAQDEASFSYAGDVKDQIGDPGIGTIMGKVLAKDWPVGEPPGIKIIHDDLAVKPPKPQNCVMSTSYLEEHFLDSTDPQQVTCSGPFQSHKRYKLAMLPTTVGGVAGQEKGIDVVFNVEAEEGERHYQVFQKINNWTGKRLGGFTIEVGTGLGDGFVAAKAENGVGVSNLSLSVPVDVWDREDQLANFSTGLFGPVDTKHDRPEGYFDPKTRAGFKILEYDTEDGNTSGRLDTLHSDGPLGSDYPNLPPGAGVAPGYQFGPWLPNNMLPQGIFFDDDGNPATDAQLVAWYGYNPKLPGLSWMTGVAGGFAEIPTATIESWGSNLTYTMGDIDDLVNVGLNYIVTIGDVTNFGGTFTVRITPQLDTSGVDGSAVGDPAYKGVIPKPILTFASPQGVVEIADSPSFEVGSLLTARVGDADLNDPDKIDTVDVQISSSSGLAETLTLEEQGIDRGVFAASLPEAFSNLQPGQTVTVTYTDESSASVISATTRAVPVTGPPAPAPAGVEITGFSVPASLYDGQTRVLSLTIQSSKESESLASGTVTLTGDNGVVETESFTDLKIGGKKKFNFKWQASLTDSDVSETVLWTATLDIDEGESKEANGSTVIEVKVKGKDR